MSQISIVQPVVGQPDTTEDPKIQNAFTLIQNTINALDNTNLAPSLAQSVAVNQSGQTVKGVAAIATAQSTSSTTYTTLATPDQVTGIVMPTNGFIAVWYQATWQQTVSTAAQAGLFLNGTQVQIAFGNLPLPVQSGGFTGTTNTPLSSFSGGLQSINSNGYTGDVTTGQLVGVVQAGGPCYIFAAAGTYTVGIEFKVTSGSVTVSNRRLWVQALSFA